MTDIFYKANLKCPICDGVLMLEDQKTLYCNGQKRHAYDLSSSGYVNLSSPKQCGGGDTKEAVRARSAFLDAGYYKPISDKILELLTLYGNGGERVVDAGCGEGYYSTAIARCGFCVIGFDLSKFATDAAAKRARREGLDNTFFVTASVFTMPIEDKCADALVNVFAPCVESEYKRVLKDKGSLIVVYAGPEHLYGLKDAIYEQVNTNEERADLPQGMSLAQKDRLTYDVTLKGNENILNLFAMTPYYWKTSQSDVKKLEGLEELTTRIDIFFALYKNET